jgi:hypothetical protein
VDGGQLGGASAIVIMAVDPALAGSAFALLDGRSNLRLVTDAVHEDDALCLALACRALRDALWARFPRRPDGDVYAGRRVRTRDVAVVAWVARLVWARGLDQPWPELRHNLTWPEEICAKAAEHGALASLQWARANNCAWGVDICIQAAAGGHLAVLQWARTNGCDWDADTCSGAAYGGHLAVLQWARANGCDWDVNACSAAAEGGHLAVLQWLGRTAATGVWPRAIRRP